MKYRDLGRTGLKVSRLGLGTMRLPMADGRVQVEEAEAVVRRALELGVNYFDAAVFYLKDESESLLGRCLKGWKKPVVISTKNHYQGDSGPDWRRNLDQSLRRLEVPAIDCYHIHALSYEAFRGPMSVPGGPWDEIRRARKEGLIRHFGFSCHDTPANMEELVKTGEFELVTLQYNLLFPQNAPVIKLAAKRGLGVIVMGPVAGGRLACPSESVARLLPDAASNAEIALRFVLDNPDVTVALSGMYSVAQVEENVRTAGRGEPLTPGERKQMLEMLNRFQRLADLYCTGCGYCLPCPHGVAIPVNFEAYILADIFGLQEGAEAQYRRLQQRTDNEGRPTPASADACRDCGLCEPRCPQRIPIRARLKETHRRLGRG
ncbi:MAG TPA: aldo/keto reductase [bacterium]|uniref:Pyridoxal 4-dehydrogenase n=1 Tax=candidate division TA06 bacterium ADurb.Bin417 TaxID=1852828 RepID=A0A1V5MHH6_UNCT6|nr:MAG: Pyridoxal 4-dehydrogenase [candidate division TA06 bacterium ADurb.Bin417]HNQ35053.1 aldo/keto reductase [bacterium]HNS48750.1 aldo/keto reductase [bacterium]